MISRLGNDRTFVSQARHTKRRLSMVDKDIAARGVRSKLVLGAMSRVPREVFIPHYLSEFAYRDAPLLIGSGQTISQPYVVALMVEALALEGAEKVLEIGTGSGYAAAVLAEIAADVYTVERIGVLASSATRQLAALGYLNVHVRHADGMRGWVEHAPYDAIVVAAGGASVPEALKTQLSVGGRLIAPLGSTSQVQELIRITRVAMDCYQTETLARVCFVPLLSGTA